MSLEDRVKWFLDMAPGSFVRPSWIADELTGKLYATGLDKFSKEKLKEIILSCGKGSDSESVPLEEAEVNQMLDDFFSHQGFKDEAPMKIFILQFSRMELFKTIRYLRSKFEDHLPVADLYRALGEAAGKYQGEKMASYIAPDRFEDSIEIKKVVEFYYQYEQMLTKDASPDGVLANFDITQELLQAVEDNAPEQVALILRHPKADPNIKSSHGTPLLHLALQNTEMVRTLLENKCDPDVFNKAGWTALYEAVDDGNIPLLQQLISSGANPNVPAEDNKMTPLHLACQSSNDFAVKALLMAGADKTLLDGDGKMALDLCDDEPRILGLLSDDKDAPAAEEAAAEAVA